ncbi:cbb3-type cytochrome c oxidase subunit 3 [Myxococcota bacterium]|nr:cbb3-type cytochrome c oxidase subunit 3 [Myxococcota bacterium]
MNPLIEAARQAATDGWLMGVMTVFFFLFFIGYAIWAWLPSNRRHMDEMAQLPLDDETPDGKSYVLRSGGPR